MVTEKVTGIILAGGKSIRFGANKALFPYKGKRMIDYALEALSPVCDEILISTNRPDDFHYTGLKTISDIYLNCGPLGGMHACLLQSGNKHNIIIGCDMPRLHPDLFLTLLKNTGDYDVVIPEHHGLHESMAGYFKKNSVLALENALKSKKYKIDDAVSLLNTLYLNVEKMPFYSATLFANINTLEDMNSLTNSDK